ncbi:MAG: type IV pilus twitching motility protein PilT [Desulfotomaculaceae bacterium]|nr:type IV pilus twitching motility protein PilT [Desulfotomaculaceae bacterium]
MMTADEILSLAFKLGVSDVHVTVNSAPAFRLHGRLLPFDAPEWEGRLGAEVAAAGKLTPEDTDRLVRQIMTETQYQKFQDIGELDFSYAIPEVCRFRVNAFKQQGSVGIVIRLINWKVLSLKDLGLPEVIVSLAHKPSGLVLVTGPTGCGKSTTLAAMLDLINNERRYHIITLEDPIEYVHRHKKCIVNQREVGKDTRSFANALRAALREDPDVILVGEMRDPETIGIALTAAETGHLVLGSLHTSSAAQTVDRIIDVFPPHQQQQIKVQLSNTIQGIIAQTLIPREDKSGRVVAVEVMIATPAVRNLIREGKAYQIINQLQTGAKFGMLSLDMALRNLYLEKLISKDEALSRATDPEMLAKMLSNGKVHDNNL